jgi:hypothetical protein
MRKVRLGDRVTRRYLPLRAVRRNYLMYARNMGLKALKRGQISTPDTIDVVGLIRVP